MIAIYPTITVIVAFTEPLLSGLALPLRFAIIVPAVTALMTWFLLPALTRIFGGWLGR